MSHITNNLIAAGIIAAGMLIALTVQPIGGVLVIIFGLHCGESKPNHRPNHTVRNPK